MRVIIAGSRTVTRQETFKAILDSGIADKITEIVSGCAQGADTYGEEWAEIYRLPLRRFPADWRRHGKAAGPIRNAQMAEAADALIAVHKLNSRGTANMIEQAHKRNLKVFVTRIG